MSCPILRLALPTPLNRCFDYLPPQGIDFAVLRPGIRVLVPFQSRHLVGILIEVVEETKVARAKLKAALAILDAEPLLAKDVAALCAWAANYYHHALGEVLAAAFPPLLRKGRALSNERVTNQTTPASVVTTAHILNAAQNAACAAIDANKDRFGVILIDGVTGSGKTEVYMQTIAAQLRAGRQVLVLVPEISLTPQMVAHFEARFSVPIALQHSSLNPTSRLRTWESVRSGETRLLIGTRSAIFASFSNLGLIIVDEEHDASFKQQDRFRYHARDLAVIRAQLNQIPIVLGSATPSLETLANVERKRYQRVVLPHRAGVALPPEYVVVNLQHASTQAGLSEALLAAMTKHLQQHNQVMLFLNRRGFAPILNCRDCMHTMACSRCDAYLVYHHKPLRLHCHYCDFKMVVPTQCVNCKGTALQPIGLGTQRLEQFLQTHFKDIPLIRVDRDNTRKKGALQGLLATINQNKQAILLGTQMLAKGHHFPHVTLVGVVDADSGLFSADFRASEQMGQLLLQVAGRAGRATQPGTVMIQTRYPAHPALQLLLKEGFAAFAEKLLAERKMAALPPYCYMATLRAEGYDEALLNQFLVLAKAQIACEANKVDVIGPLPALMTKRKGLYCQQLIFKSEKRPILQRYLRNIQMLIEQMTDAKKIKWLLDVDPMEL